MTYTYSLETRVDGERLEHAPTYEAMLCRVKDYYRDAPTLVVIGVVASEANDAWVKTWSAPTDIFIEQLRQEAGCNVKVRPPGHHPGGRAWWIDPENAVFVPVFKHVLK